MKLSSIITMLFVDPIWDDKNHIPTWVKPGDKIMVYTTFSEERIVNRVLGNNLLDYSRGIVYAHYCMKVDN